MISYSYITSKGDRQVNEDSIGHYVNENIGLFIVADGLGGHGSGDVASRYVAEEYLMRYGEEYRDDAPRYFSEVFASVQTGLLNMQKETSKDMKSTAAAVILTDKRLDICHIGDTRIYIFAKKKILYKTQDHSVPQMLVSAGEIKEKDIRFHPDRNRLLRALGEDAETAECDIYSMNLTPDIKGVLICSDGFWEYVTEREMLRSWKAADSAEKWIAAMNKIVLKNSRKHKKDNYSAIGVVVA